MFPVCALLIFLLSVLLIDVQSSSPPKLSPVSVPEQLSEGSPLRAFCFAIAGSDPLAFKWVFNGRTVLSSSSNIQIDNDAKSSLLKFNSVKESDAGNYTCQVSNQFGSDSQSAVLKVSGQSFQCFVIEFCF